MWTFLFDIDGTLLRTGGAGMVAIRRAFSELFGFDNVQRVPVHGRTDFGILSEMFHQFDLDPETHLRRFNEAYWDFLPAALLEVEGRVLPGVMDLLDELTKREDVALGLLTGNSERAAMIKLEHFGLIHFFDFGGYGEWHVDRDDVAGLAKQAAQAHVGRNFREDKLWVIGDTVNDIRCARAIDSQVAVVETGGADPSELNSAKPDLQIPDLSDTRMLLQHLIAG